MKRAGLAWFKGVYNCERTMLKNTFEIHTKNKYTKNVYEFGIFSTKFWGL